MVIQLYLQAISSITWFAKWQSLLVVNEMMGVVGAMWGNTLKVQCLELSGGSNDESKGNEWSREGMFGALSVKYRDLGVSILLGRLKCTFYPLGNESHKFIF